MYNRARQLYKNISMLFLFPVKYGVSAQRYLSCYNTVKTASNGEQITRNSASFRHSKRYKIMPKMYKNTIGGRAPPGPAGGALALPRPPSRNLGAVSYTHLTLPTIYSV